MWLDVMMILVNHIGDYIYEVYLVEYVCILGCENHLVFGLPVKEPSFMSIVVWVRIVFYVPRRGCLGT